MWSRTQRLRGSSAGILCQVVTGQWAGMTPIGSVQSWHPALSRRTLIRSWSLWAVRVQIPSGKSCFGVEVLGSGYWPDLSCLFILVQMSTEWARAQGNHDGSEERAVWKAREFWFFNSASLAGWMRWSWPSWNCRVDFPVVFHCWRSHRHTEPLSEHCLPPTIWSRWPVCHLKWVPLLCLRRCFFKKN